MVGVSESVSEWAMWLFERANKEGMKKGSGRFGFQTEIHNKKGDWRLFDDTFHSHRIAFAMHIYSSASKIHAPNNAPGRHAEKQLTNSSHLIPIPKRKTQKTP